METIHPEKVVAILKAHGSTVSLEEAKIILEFMQKLALMAINVYVNDESRFIYPGKHG